MRKVFKIYIEEKLSIRTFETALKYDSGKLQSERRVRKAWPDCENRETVLIKLFGTAII